MANPGLSRLTSAVIVDRLPLARMGLARVFDTVHIDVVGEFAESKPALTHVASNDVDLVVLGNFDDSNPLNVLRKVNQLGDAKTVVLVEQMAGNDIAELIHAGVQGLLLRATEVAELADSLRRIRKGERIIGAQLAAIATGKYEETEPEDADETLLTKKEMQVLRLMAAGQSNGEIGESLFVTMPTVKTHVAHILAKFGVKNRAEAVARALELGLLR